MRIRHPTQIIRDSDGNRLDPIYNADQATTADQMPCDWIASLVQLVGSLVRLI